MEERTDVATADEVLQYLSGVMRGDESANTPAMKAAELLGKRLGLFEEREGELAPPVIIDDLGAVPDG